MSNRKPFLSVIVPEHNSAAFMRPGSLTWQIHEGLLDPTIPEV